MNIINIATQTQWNEYLNQCSKKTFLQTWEWGEFQKAQGHDIQRLAIFEYNQLIGITLCTVNKSLFSNYTYCPRGPLLVEDSAKTYTEVLKELKEYWRQEGIYSIKIDPAFIESSELAQIPQTMGFTHSVNFVQSETNWMIDLVGNTEDELFEWCKQHGMGKNYPTYIRKARREGVTISFSKELEDWKLFHKYLTQSGEKKSFEVKPLQYFVNLWEYLGKDSDIARLGIAKRDGKVLAMILITVFGDEVSCLYSAQTDIDTKLRAPMLLRWECMLLGQKEHIKRFNNWGVLPESKYKPGVPGYGYSQYKRGFGGYLEQIERTYEYIYQKKYLPLEKLHDWYIKLRYYRFR